jgi:4-alpha-glucanotransferase
VVVGEDLGTVPDGFRARLSEHGIWGYRVMLFERNHDGSFLAPEHYAANALVTFNTHDLPTFAGWRTGHDMAVKRGLGLDPGETDEDRRCSLRWLEEATGAADAGRDVDNAFDSALGFLSRTPSRILAVALEDLLGVADQPNIPGTIDQYPNWRRKLHVPLEALDAALDAVRLRRLLAGRSLSDNATD